MARGIEYGRADIRLAAAVAGLATTQTIGWGTTYFLPAVIAEEIMADLGLSRDGVFAGVTVMLLVAGALGPRAGAWTDRLGPKRLLCAGSLILAASLALLAAGTAPATYYLAWAGLGLGVPAGLTIAAHTAIARLSPAAARRSIGTLMLFTGLASTVFWPLTSVLTEAIGWRLTCLAFAGLNLLVCLPIHLALPPGAATPAAPGSEHNAPAELRPAAPATSRSKALVLLAIAFSLQGFVSWGLTLHLIALFTATGMSMATAVAIAALTGPAVVGARLLDVLLAGRVAPLLTANAAMAAMPLTFALLLAGGGSPLIATVFVLLNGAANGIMSVARATLPLTLFGSEAFARVLGVLSLPQNTAYALSPLLFSMIIERWGTDAALQTAFVSVLLAWAAIAALAGFVVRQPG